MKFGLFTLTELPPGRDAHTAYREIVEQAAYAEQLGFHGIWIAEHHWSAYGGCPSPAVLGTAIAQRTEKLRIGSAVSILPYQDPRRIAEDYAMLDCISGGRLDFGVGRGYQPKEYAGFGIDMDESRGRFREALDVIEGLWTTEGFSYKGEFFQVDDLTISPFPVQSPPPIWMAAVSPESFTLAAEAGRPFMSAPQFTPLPKIRAGYDVYREALTKAGHDPAGFDLPLQRQVYVGASYEEARETPRDHVMFYQRMNAELLSSPTAVSESFKMYRKAQQTMLKVEYEDLLEKEAVLFDTAENLVPRIAELERELGLTYLICKMNVGGLPHDKVMRSMERFAEHVMPHFPDRTLEPAASASDPSPL